MSKGQKTVLMRIIISAVLLTAALAVPMNGTVSDIFCFASFLIIGFDVLIKAVKNICHGQIFDENFLMSVATVGALCIGEYHEAVAVMLFYQVGELFQSYAVGKSRKSISGLMDIRPDYANLYKDGKTEKTDPYDVKAGDIIVVKPGEKVPLDGIVTEGASSLNTIALTGESLPRDINVGDSVISGCINLSGLIKVKVTSEFEASTVSKILELVENSGANKAKAESFITRFAKYYTPIVVASALLLAIVPPLFLGGGMWGEWIYRALTFLVVSCPCALVISVPMSFFAGIGAASKNGILVKGGNYLEALSKAETIVFDKTGTLTKGNFIVTAVHPEKMKKEELLRISALCESYSSHPIALSIQKAYGKQIDKDSVKKVKELSGLGITCELEGKTIHIGNKRLMDNIGINCSDCENIGTIVHAAVDNEYAGHIVISDEIKPDSKSALKRLRSIGVKNTVMLTGDKKEVGEAIGNELKLNEVYAELLPADKVSVLEKLIEKKSPKGKVLFVGDGINDAPVLSRADIGIAMGAMGSDAAIEAADVVLMDDKISKIPLAIKISRKTRKIVTENIVFALVVKIAVLLLCAIGQANMWEAVFADVGVAVIAILNSMRAMRI